MAIEMISAVLYTDGIDPGQKFTLVCLANCWNAVEKVARPSVSYLSKLTGFSERAIQGHLQALEISGYITRKERSGKPTLYAFNPRRFCTPAESAPPQNLHPTPAESAPLPPQNLHPKRNTNEKKQREGIPCPVGVPMQAWSDWLKVRSAKKKPITSSALASLQREADKAGVPVAVAVTLCAERGWLSIKADWPEVQALAANIKGGHPPKFINAY